MRARTRSCAPTHLEIAMSRITHQLVVDHPEGPSDVYLTSLTQITKASLGKEPGATRDHVLAMLTLQSHEGWTTQLAFRPGQIPDLLDIAGVRDWSALIGRDVLELERPGTGRAAGIAHHTEARMLLAL